MDMANQPALISAWATLECPYKALHINAVWKETSSASKLAPGLSGQIETNQKTAYNAQHYMHTNLNIFLFNELCIPLWKHRK